MRNWKPFLLAGLMLFGGLSRIVAQPAAPLPPAAPIPPAGPAVPAALPAPASAGTIWNKLGITKEGCKECKDKFCKSPLGQLVNNLVKPMTMATGGLFGPCCPPPSATDLLKQANDPNASAGESAAAKIKADEAGAAARRDAIRYLGTVDCHYFPEAEGALIIGLRADRNECVRMEAALALSKGCCCTKKTLAALTVAVNGTETDNNPAEKSERVKALALCALNHCMTRYCETGEPAQLPPEPPPEAVPPEKPLTPGQADRALIQQASYLIRRTQAPPQLIEVAGRTLATRVGLNPPTPVSSANSRSLIGLFANASAARGPGEAIPFEEAALVGSIEAQTLSVALPAATPMQPVAPSRPEPIRPVGLIGGSALVDRPLP